MSTTNKTGPEQHPAFLFVHQDATAQSFLKKDRNLNRSKQSHVQRQHIAKKRQALSNQTSTRSPEDLKELGTWTESSSPSSKIRCIAFVTSTPVGLSPIVDGSEAGKCSDPSAKPRRRAGPELIRNWQDSPHNASSMSRHFRNQIDTAKWSAYWRVQSSSCLPYSPLSPSLEPLTESTWSTDEYSKILGLDLRAWTRDLVAYYTTIVVPSIFRADSRALKATSEHHGRNVLAVQDELRTCMTDPAYLFAFLAAQCARMEAVEGRLMLPNVPRNQLEQGPRILKTQSIQELRSRLVHGYVDQQMIYDVYRLYSGEVIARDFEVAAVHFRALDFMVKAVGGLDSLDRFLRDKIITAEIFAAASRLCPPKLDLTWDPGDLSEELVAKVQPPSDSILRTIGGWFRSLANTTLFDRDMRSVIDDLISETWLNVYSWSHADLTDDQMSYMLLRRTAIEHRLLSFSISRQSSGMERRIHDVFKTALIFWMGLTFADPIRRQTIPPLLNQYRRMLQDYATQSSHSRKLELLLWLYVVGTIAAEDTDDYLWFASKSREIAITIGVTEESSLHEILGQFFYIREVQGQSVTKLLSSFGPLVLPTNEQEAFYELSTPGGVT